MELEGVSLVGAVEDHAREVEVLAKVCLVSSPYKEKTKQHSKSGKKKKLHISMHTSLMIKSGFTMSN